MRVCSRGFPSGQRLSMDVVRWFMGVIAEYGTESIGCQLPAWLLSLSYARGGWVGEEIDQGPTETGGPTNRGAGLE